MPFPQSRPPTWVASPLPLPVPENPPLPSRLHWACYRQRPPLPHLLDNLHTPTATFPGRRAQASLRPRPKPGIGSSVLGRWAARRAPERTPRVPSRSAGKGASPSRSPCAPSCLAGWMAAHAQTLDSAAAWCFDTPWADPRAGRDSGAARPRQAQGSQRTPKEGGFSPRPPAHPREGPPNIPLSLSRARGRRHPSCCGRVTRPGSPRPGGRTAAAGVHPSCSVWESAQGAERRARLQRPPAGAGQEGLRGSRQPPPSSPSPHPHASIPGRRVPPSLDGCLHSTGGAWAPLPPADHAEAGRTPKCWAQATSLCPDPGCVPGAAGSSAGFTPLGSTSGNARGLQL